jgi:hypothetical protein
MRQKCLPTKISGNSFEHIVLDALKLFSVKFFRLIEVKLWPLPSLVYADGLYDV